MKILREERGIVVDWLLKMVLFIGILVVILFDGGSIAVNIFGLDSAADEVANVVSTHVVRQSGTRFTDFQIWELANNTIEEFGYGGAKLVKKGSGIDPDGKITIKLRRTATTLIVSRVGFMKDWAKATAEGTATAQ
ncbi:MAG TPA: hypothetical protein VHJ82_03755 [Actinomycetota bacterium]|nr:hypothetical protein [Actinomycetota bacterium]